MRMNKVKKIFVGMSIIVGVTVALGLVVYGVINAIQDFYSDTTPFPKNTMRVPYIFYFSSWVIGPLMNAVNV